MVHVPPCLSSYLHSMSALLVLQAITVISTIVLFHFQLLQKEPLRFHLDTTLLAPHLVDLVLEIQRIAESTLFHWKTFPLNLPQPIAVQEFSEGSASTRRKPLVVDNLFDIPSWDDLDVVSVDAHGEAKHLSNKQLTSVRQHGYV